jgi:DNA polymerase
MEDLLAGRHDLIDLLHSPFEIVASLMRGMLRAAAGHRLVVADLAGIEARIVNWLAGQWDVLAKFASGEDVYMYNAIRRFGLPVTATRASHPVERQSGKAIELGAGFGMGWLKHQATIAKPPYSRHILEQEARSDIDFYRASHSHVVQLWREVEGAARAAVLEPGTVQRVGVGAGVRYTCRGGRLWAILPSGRPMVYTRPRIVERPAPWDPSQSRPALEADGMDPKTHQWGPKSLYGGKLVENLVQAIARDVLAEAMVRVEAAGYPVVLTVHDEIVAETPLGVGSVEEYVQLIETIPVWATRLPVAAEGWEGERYGK